MNNIHPIHNKEYYFETQSSLSVMQDAHFHNQYEIYYLLSGSQKYFISGSTYEVKKGNIVLIRPNLIHKTTCGYGGLRYLLYFTNDFLKKYLTEDAIKLLLSFFDKIIVSPLSNQTSKVLDLFNQIKDATEVNDEKRIFTLLLNLFLLLSNSPSTILEHKQAEPPILTATIDYIEKNYNNITGLDEVASKFFVSKYYLCKLFSKHLQTTYNDYLMQLKLKNAEALLRKTNQTISKIAYTCGFNSSAYFCYVFKAKFKISPLKYRELFTTATK